MRSQMEAIRSLIGEGDVATRNTLLQALEHEVDFEVIGACETAPQLIAAANETRPDLLLIDTMMAGTSGFSVLDAVVVTNPPNVIFVADSERYAARAFEVGALDYLVKPVGPPRLELAIDRARRHISAPDAVAVSEGREELLPPFAGADNSFAGGSNGRCLRWIVVRSVGKIRFVCSDEVDWIEARGDHLVIHTGNAAHTIRGTMKAMEQRLDPDKFLRIHRSTIVNLSRVKELQPYFHGEFVVVLDDGTSLRMSRGRRDSLEQLLGQPI